jgi:putative CocE/NonD family hydrolase
MIDGAVLMADHYYPKADGSFPTVLIRTPYGRGLEVPLPLGLINLFYSMRFAERGYHVLAQTVRGRYDSQGEFRPFVNERADGLSTLEWIAHQPWFNGTAAMWGPSYLGYAQWAVACSSPPFLKAIFPSVAGSRIDSIVYPDGTVGLDSILRWVQVLDLLDTARGWAGWGGRAVWRQTRIGSNPRALRQATMHLPVIKAPEVALGKHVEGRFDWILEMEPGQSRHKELDQANFSDLVCDVTAPAHLLTGWYDIFLRQVLADYAVLRAAGRNPYLTIGPWGHADGGMAAESLRGGIAWFDAHLKGDKAALREQPVKVYVMGAGRWREMGAWPPPTSERRLFLHSEGHLAPSPPGPDSPPDRFRYDPADPTPAVGGALIMPPYGRMDNRVLEARPDVLCYTTAPLARAAEVIGPVRLELYASSTLEHTDFYGRLCDVYPDGRSINVCDGLFRVEPGKGERLPDGILRLEVSLWATANRFKRGHRIRLQVSSGAHPRWARNLGTGAHMTTGITMRPADQTVYHDSAHPSALVLSLFP